MPEKNLEDGLHPTTEGQEKLADKVLPALREARGGDGALNSFKESARPADVFGPA